MPFFNSKSKMQIISVSSELKEKVKELQLFCIESDVVLRTTPDELWDLITDTCKELNSKVKIEEISALPAVQASRRAYKAAGKDPARYRLSAEALLRRAIKEKELYRINNVVDLLNLVSIESGFSIGGYDAESISGEVEFGIGRKDEPYTGIGRGPLNIEGLPVFRDDLGAFGSPTSDSERTSVTDGTRRFLMVIIGFGATHLLQEAGERAVALLKRFAQAENIEIKVIT
jgi:DNA/RNA-binding domain of Phe-tRNA-synthetase-like protein